MVGIYLSHAIEHLEYVQSVAPSLPVLRAVDTPKEDE